MNRLVLFLLAIGICAAQGPKIFIVTDMEGVGGVNNANEQLLPGQRRYDESRHLPAGGVNAAVAGALEAGARLVVIWDGHDSSRSLSIEDPSARAAHPGVRHNAGLLPQRETLRRYYVRGPTCHGWR